MSFFGESVLIITLLRADSWREFPSTEEEPAKVAAKVAFAGKTVLVGLIAESPGNGEKAVRALLD